MKFVIIILLFKIKSFALNMIIDIECDEVQRNSGYISPICTISSVDYSNSTVEYNFKSRNIFDQYTYSYKTNLFFFKNIEFKSSTTPEIPRKLFQRFEKLETLKMSDTGIEELHRFTFEHASNLITLDLARNNLTKLEKGTFSGATSLVTIDLSGNEIATIDEKAFIEISNLKTLILSSNKIANIHIKTFEYIKNLRNIKLDNNQLEQMPGDIFLGNQQIQVIDLSGNKMNSFNLLLFDNMPNILKFVDISYNMLYSFSINCQTFSYKYDHPEYLYLNLSNNFLENIDISTNFSVTHLYLGSNNITCIEKVSMLKDLIELDLSFNKIGKLEVTSFSNLSQLLYLNLETTGISNIEYGTFSHQTRLITLDIAYNKLKELNLLMFASLSELQSIYIDGNNLTSIDYIQLLNTFPKLGAIGMQDNQFNCTDLAKMISELTRREIRIDIVEDAKVVDRSNVKGVGCIKDDKDKNMQWHEPIHHVHIHNSSDEHNLITEKVNHLIDIVHELNFTIQENIKLKNEYNDMKNRLVELTSNFYEIKSNLISHQISSFTNNSSSLNSKEIKNLIEVMNNMTLDRQKLALDKLRQQLVELEFDVRKNTDKIGSGSAVIRKDARFQNPEADNKGIDLPTKIMITLIFLILTMFLLFKMLLYVKGIGRFQRNFRPRTDTLTTLHSTIEHAI